MTGSIAQRTLVLLGLCSACVSSPDLGGDHRPIISGDPVSGDAYATVGAITTNIGSICTGTLIAPDVVLTAAHCVEPMMLKQSAQAAGETPPDEITYQFTFARDLKGASSGDFLEVTDVIWHEQFLADLEAVFTPGVSQWNDIALVFLAEPQTDRPLQALAPDDVVSALDSEERMVAVAGYGLTSNENAMSAGVLTSGQSGLDQLGEFEILAGEGDQQQACRGDSGGPIFADDGDTYQIGIASRINANLFPPPSEPPPCETGLLYTRVDSYLPWVEEHMGGAITEPEDPDDGNDDDGTDGEDEDGEGGGCAAGGAPSGGAALILLLVVAVLRRRPAL